MSITASELTPADIAACTGNCNNGNGNGMFGNDWAWIIILLLFGYGRNGFGGGFGGGGATGANTTCASTADVYNAVDQQTLISKLDQQTYGLADTFTALNNTLNSNFRGIDNAICTLGYQNQAGTNAISAQLAQCCCNIERAIDGNTTSGVMNTNSLSRQISDCCCDLEKMNMQNRFDAQAYNCNTLQAIDKLGDRIIDYMVTEKTQALRDENQALRLAASQSNQNNVIRAAIDASTAEIIRRTGNECPVPAYVVPNPNCCYGNPLGVGYGYNNNGGCNNGCGGSF